MIKPLSDHVVLETVKEEKKKGSIILPETVEKERSEIGKVVAVGQGKLDDNGKRVPIDVKKGDTVFYRKYSEHKIKDGDREYIVIKGEDILAVK
ncbi:MAG: co-chaperone GroES [Candidatus Yanofskybacteria bacterium RIFCSPLOWO2_01_FULL_49_17]|uniref:Co-chaperonin GroES n=1 Tax=Candidatus Yanofskybacteria bacterium RIFCSPLOWO2_01_FULL_49_17 TaxID=1802700 RepID=A0A1F8GNV6_9BACT|nr:MAG: co-chaperone GroES [Candidatus Yanofskybacteria bacterium RIFCSPLOWO2_01_FULL_49_17]